MTDAIAIDLIQRGIRIRPVNQKTVASLAESIGAVGLLNPITVRPGMIVTGGRARDGYILVGGLHRLEAMVQRGATHIPAVVVAMDDLVAIIAECDENLCGSNLSQSERALFTRRRKEAYEALHPETKNGGDRRGPDRQVGELKEADRFTADAAAKTGKPERTIQRDAERGENIPAPILAEIAGTDLDKGVVLDRLKNADDAAAELETIRAERDAKKAERLLAEEAAKEAKKANAATDIVIRLTVEQQYADWIMRHVAGSELDTLISWIQAAKPAGVIAAMRRAA